MYVVSQKAQDVKYDTATTAGPAGAVSERWFRLTVEYEGNISGHNEVSLFMLLMRRVAEIHQQHTTTCPVTMETAGCTSQMG